MKNTINELKNSPEEVNSRLDQEGERIHKHWKLFSQRNTLKNIKKE